MMREDTSDIACVDIQQSGDHNPCYIPTKIGMVTGGSGSMEMAAVSSLHDVFCMQQCFRFLEWLHTGQGQTPLT